MSTIVYSKEKCPFCVKAIALLEEKGVSFTVLKIGVEVTKEEMVERILLDTGVEVTTVPQIFLDGVYIGGFTDLEQHYQGQETENISFAGMEL
ncbi:glutaredoxin domain-containing protein [Vibrio splendidus]|nr:glutaredoxin domain-containing protein [Vibrio splendidus]MCC4880532.1 glutaredoxin [Vibrio splendidus]